MGKRKLLAGLAPVLIACLSVMAYGSAGPAAGGVDLGPDHSQEAKPGQIIHYEHVLENTGTTTDTFSVDALSTRNWPVGFLGEGHPPETQALTVELGAQLSATLQVSLTVPSHARGVTEVTVITATSQLSPTVQDVATDTTFVPAMVYLPVVARRWPPLPDRPTLHPISNPDGDGSYLVSWTSAYLADTYTLQEDDNAGFSSPTERYSGSGTWWTASGKAPGTYSYRVKASNSWGDSGWSNIRWVTVTPPPPLTLYLHRRDGAPRYFLSTKMDNGDETIDGFYGVTEWVINLEQDLAGTEYAYSVYACGGLQDVTCDVEILLRRGGSDTMLARWPEAFAALDGEFEWHTGAKTGADPDAGAGDTLVLRIRTHDGGITMLMGDFYGTPGYSRIEVPGYRP